MEVLCEVVLPSRVSFSEGKGKGDGERICPSTIFHSHFGIIVVFFAVYSRTGKHSTSYITAVELFQFYFLCEEYLISNVMKERVAYLFIM